MEKFLCEDKVIKSVVLPGAFAAATGSRVSMANAKRVTFIVDVGVGTSTSAHKVILQQHDAATAGTSGDLEITNPYYKKINTATEFTKVDVRTATATYDLHSVLADYKAIVVFEVLAEDLTDGYGWVSVNTGAATGTQSGVVIAIVEPDFKPGYEQEV
jgi:hypothetical protein